MTKKEIRQSIKKMRSELPEALHRDMTQDIFKKIISLKEYADANVVYAYMDAANEVGTKNLIEHAFDHGKEVAVPKIEDGIMNFYQICSLDEVSPGYFGILEPQGKRIPKTPDIVIVPGVAFSLRKERLGYGGGFYDRFLSKDVFKIGLAFEFQLVDELPVEGFDVSMDMIITEQQIIK